MATAPLGRVIVVGGRALTIIGVVANSRFRSLREDRPIPMAYGALAQTSTMGGALGPLRFVLRTDRPEDVRRAAAAALLRVDPRLGLEVRTMEDDALATITRERLLARVGGLLAAVGLFIAVAGVYGTFAYAVARRRKEIGVGVALGGTRGDVIALFALDATRMVVCSCGAGLLLALAGGRFIESVLFDTSSSDPVTLAAAIAAILCTVAIATFIPAHRAASVLPADALRQE